jgi:hypothetical protein
MADVSEPGLRKYRRQKLSSLKTDRHAITNKCPEASSVVQQVHKVLCDIEILAECTSTEVWESCQWTIIENSAEENRANFCKVLDLKQLFSALCGMYMVTLNEMKAILKVNAQAGQIGTVNKNSSESAA